MSDAEPSSGLDRRAFTALAATAILAPVSSPATPAPVGDSRTLLDRAFAAFFAGWRSGNWAPFLALCAADFVFQFPAGPQAGRHAGRDGRAALEAWCAQHVRAGNRIDRSSDVLRLYDGPWGIACDRGEGTIDGQPYDGLHAIFMRAEMNAIVEFREYFGRIDLPPAAPPSREIDFLLTTVPDPAGPPMEVGIWHPTTGGAVPEGLPLVVMSHGNRGIYSGHADTAKALAGAGFVAAALTHTGDNYRDHSREADMADRVRQLHVLVDHMLTASPWKTRIDPLRVGAFGFSSGGFTVLALAGGRPDLARISAHCEEDPRFFDCSVGGGEAQPPSQAWVHDARIRAVVSAAPALGFTFAGGGLRHVTVPVQLWRAERDEILPHPHYAEVVRNELPTPPEYHVVPGARHFAFMTPCPEQERIALGPICDDPQGFDRQQFHDTFNTAVVAFFSRHLAAPNPGADAFPRTGNVPNDRSAPPARSRNEPSA